MPTKKLQNQLTPQDNMVADGRVSCVNSSAVRFHGTGPEHNLHPILKLLIRKNAPLRKNIVMQFQSFHFFAGKICHV